MARQVTFFMAREDEDTFLTFLKSTGDVALVPSVSSNNDFQPIDRLPEPFSEDFWRQFWFWNRSITPSFRSEFVPEKGYYIINGLLSSLVEFSRSCIKGDTMFPGRIWAEFTVVDDETNDLGQKDRAFKNWYEDLAKWIRREFVHTGWMMFAGPGALKFQEEGGKLPIGL